MIEKVNIRATAFQEFWGTEYNSDLYLWEGAKHNLTLTEIENIEGDTFKDRFSSETDVDEAMQQCKSLYFKFLPMVSTQLNTYHNLNLSDDFWRLAFGYWFYRHICVVFEKYMYLSKIAIDKTSIKLLDRESYYVPKDSIEHFELFGHDFGVQQLVSEYYYMFAQKKFEVIKKDYHAPNSDKKPKLKNTKKEVKVKTPSLVKALLKRYLSPRIVLLNTYFTAQYVKKILFRSRGKIMWIDLPPVDITTSDWDLNKRNKIFQMESKDPLERYLINSFTYCFPRIFIENFKNYYYSYLNDIRKSNFSYIISEGWIGRNNVAIYCAVANEVEKKLVFQEHASSCSLVERSFLWFYLSFSQPFLTTGWTSNKPNTNIVPGSFLAKSPQKYSFDNKQSTVLYVSQSATPYLMEFSWHPSNAGFLYTLKSTRKLLRLLPDSVRENFKYRARKDITLWNTTHTLELEGKSEMLDKQAFHDSIHNSRVVIIDHLSTAITELLLMEVPFLLLINPHTIISNEAQPFVNKMVECGVVHFTPESLVEKLTEVYDNIEYWWKNDEVKSSVLNFKSSFIASPSNTFGFLFSCLNDKSMRK